MGSTSHLVGRSQEMDRLAGVLTGDRRAMGDRGPGGMGTTAFSFADQDVAISLSGPLVPEDALVERGARRRHDLHAFTDEHAAAVQRRP